MEKEKENFDQVNLLSTKQNMDTPFITEDEATVEQLDDDNFEIDSDVNKDEKVRILDEP